MRSPVTTLLTFGVLTLAQLGFAIDPVVVVYSDPSLTRLEKEIAVTPAQKDRFDDIVVKYRDPESSNAGPKAGADAESSANPHSGGRGGAGGGRGRGGGGGSAFTGAKGNNLREELDELATVLTPGQLKKFKELNQRKKKTPRAAS